MYTGVDPNKWLVRDGIKRETGRDLISIKKPHFYFADNLSGLSVSKVFDFALAQSIFSHCGPDLVVRWLREISVHLRGTGVLVATFLTGDVDCVAAGWTYPGCVAYRPERVREMAQDAGMLFVELNWKHPRQTWALFCKPEFDRTLSDGGEVSWNKMMAHQVV
ncbi:MAG TPA: hypothetical protein VF292_02560 [Rhodanobacteraceae bacterium]